jgi:hypothetical protein
MNMPSFTAEASLCKARGHYQTARYAVNSRKQMISAVYLAMENIEVHGCAPGYSLWEDAGDWGCIRDVPLGGGGGGGGGGSPGGQPSDGSGGGGGGGSGSDSGGSQPSTVDTIIGTGWGKECWETSRPGKGREERVRLCCNQKQRDWIAGGADAARGRAAGAVCRNTPQPPPPTGPTSSAA